jgi:hypothetical protein
MVCGKYFLSECDTPEETSPNKIKTLDLNSF